MAEFKIIFMGLCLFAKLSAEPGRTVILPELGSGVEVETPRGRTMVESHEAYISVHVDNVVSCDGCTLGGSRQMLSLDGDQVTIAGPTEPFKEGTWAETIPQMHEVCPRFELAQETPGATRIALQSGTLSAEKNEPGNSILTAKLSGNVTFELRKGTTVRRLVVQPAATVWIVNRYANHLRRNPKVPPLADNHWLAYYTLAKEPVLCDLPAYPQPHHGTESTIACSNSGYP